MNRHDTYGNVLATYVYDAWGNVTETVELADGGNAIANLNPLRYRGYYFDTDTGYYYLNARYYNAEWGRMISPDNADVVTITPMAFTDKNLYAYCDNNPVMRTDNGGEWWNVIAGAIVGAAVNLVTSVVSELVEGNIKPKDFAQIAASTVIGAIEGALIAVCPSAASLISAGANMVDTFVDGAIEGKNIQENAVDSIVSGAIGAVSGAGGGDFIKGGKLLNEAGNSLKKVFSKGVHPTIKKAAKKTIKKAAKTMIKSIGYGTFESIAYDGIYQYTSWHVKKISNRMFGG